MKEKPSYEELEARVRGLERECEVKETADTELRDANEFLDKLLANPYLLIAYLDPDFNFLCVNQSYADAGGHPPGYFIGKNHFELYPHDDNEAIFREVVETGEAYTAFAKPFEYSDQPERGTTYWDWTLYPSKDESGEVEALILCLIDVTERVNAQRELRESEEKYRVLFENSSDGIFMTSREGSILEANAAMEGLFGYTREELREDMNAEDLYADPQDRLRFRRRIERKGSVRNYETEFRRKDGSLIHCLYSGSVWLLEDGSIGGYQGIIHDITERKRAEDALQGSESRLRELSVRLLEAQERERKLIANELHDSVGANLSAIKYGLDRKLNEMGEGPAPAGLALEQLVDMVQRTIEETRRISTNLRPAMLDDLGLLSTLNWYCREFQELHPGIRVEKEVGVTESEVPEPLKIVIFRVVQEAFNNVAKHSGADRVRLSISRSDRSIGLEIEDNGRGFNPGGGGPKPDVSGMGLSSMRERSELAGGVFSIHSGGERGALIRAGWPTHGAPD